MMYVFIGAKIFCLFLLSYYLMGFTFLPKYSTYDFKVSVSFRFQFALHAEIRCFLAVSFYRTQPLAYENYFQQNAVPYTQTTNCYRVKT